jgi:L-asparaginase II
MMNESTAALLQVTRGNIVESTHYGAIAVADTDGRLLYSCGDPATIAFLRSAAKPIQALPFFESNGPERLGLSGEERALICASHEGSEKHVQTAVSLQRKAGIDESELQCGVHMPGDAAAYRALITLGKAPTPNHNNCSGKHSAMLALSTMRGWPLESYLEPDHEVQREILKAVSEMSGLPRDEVEVGTDGCSAPNFATPLINIATAYARLCDPRGLEDMRQAAARDITAAMTAHPEMISGEGEFDCRLMQVGKAKIICKRGAEGLQAIGLTPGLLAGRSVGIGIALKVSDGDHAVRNMELVPRNRVRPAVALEILRQLGILRPQQLGELTDFGPELPVLNHRGLVTGTARSVFQLAKAM